MAGWRKTQALRALILVGISPIFIYIICSSQTTHFVFKRNIEPTPEWNKDNVSHSPQKLNKLITRRCPRVPPNLVGPIVANTDVSLNTMDELEHSLSGVLYPGGWYRPAHCIPRHRVAIIVPFRNRFIQLMTLLQNIHPFLIKQQIEYRIFVVEQQPDGKAFNKGSLFNAAFLEALKLSEWTCFIFHDVDLVPIDDRNLYGCMHQPRHLSVAIDVLDFKLPYVNLVGGVLAMTQKQFETVNGYSNSFWGWGGEDDDLAYRMENADYKLIRWYGEIARYKMIRHLKEVPNEKRFKLVEDGQGKFYTDGLNSVQYDLVTTKRNVLYTWFLVKVKLSNGTRLVNKKKIN